MKRIAIAALALGLIIGCQKKDSSEEMAQSTTTQQETQAQPQNTQGPPMRPSDARVETEAVTVAAGQSGSFKVNYFGVEPAKAPRSQRP